MIKRALLLSSGLGTRLRPLTEKIPKPLVPIFQKPLLTFAIDHLVACGIEEIGVNVRYLWESFYKEFHVQTTSDGKEKGVYEGHSLHFFKEDSYLDTGGSLRNARNFLEQGTFLIHNGDILTNIELEGLFRQHEESGALATLLLREQGGPLNVCYDETSNRVVDIRGNFSHSEYPLFLYACIAIVEPTIFQFITPEGEVSLIDALLKAMQAGHHIGGFVSRKGFWSDIGTPESYLKTHAEIAKASWKFYYPLQGPKAETWPEAIDEGGSDRQFYRLQSASGENLILVHYNPEKAENNYYAEHAHFLKTYSIHVPNVIEHDADGHLLWLQDLGEKNLWSQRGEPWSVRRLLYESVLVDVARLHRIPLIAVEEQGITLQKEFDNDLYRWEQNYFLEHALGELFYVNLETRKNLASSHSLQQLATHLAALPRQLIHRDLQSQNIILLDNQAWLIDFQGMRAGLAPYDLASLLCDPYVSMTAPEREALMTFYEEEMKRHDFSFPYDFKKVFWQCAVQRLMQALGAYGFLSLHRGKQKFQRYITPALLELRNALKNLSPENRLEALEKVLSSLPSTLYSLNH